jgi:hypothetical protein
VDVPANFAPRLQRSIAAELLDCAHGAIEGHPGHDLRVREVAPRTAHLPDALVRLLPVVDHEVNQVPGQRPRFVVERAHAELPRQMERVEHLAVHVELELRGGALPILTGLDFS